MANLAGFGWHVSTSSLHVRLGTSLGSWPRCWSICSNMWPTAYGSSLICSSIKHPQLMVPVFKKLHDKVVLTKRKTIFGKDVSELLCKPSFETCFRYIINLYFALETRKVPQQRTCFDQISEYFLSLLGNLKSQFLVDLPSTQQGFVSSKFKFNTQRFIAFRRRQINALVFPLSM